MVYCADGTRRALHKRRGPVNKPRVITLPWPHKALQSNARVHWAVEARAKKDARNTAWAVCMQSPRIGCEPNATLFIEYYPKTYRGDIHNVASSLKSYIDGIADAMGCDDKLFTVDYPTKWAGKSDPGKVVFRIVPPVVDIPLAGTVVGGKVVWE